jgi:excisionase family DNA binding protein
MTPAPQPDPDSGYLTAEQIAAELGLHVQTVQRYFREGLIPGRKLGKSWRTTRAAFDTWLTAGPVPARLEGTASGVDLEVKG